MSDIIFEDLAAKIAAGTATAEEILAYVCAELTTVEKQALLNSLSAKLVADGTELELASVLSGIATSAESPLVIPAFLIGRIQVIDTDYSATLDLTGTHQFVTDSNGDSYPEESIMEWGAMQGKYYAARSLTIPVGVTVLYTFLLKD